MATGSRRTEALVGLFVFVGLALLGGLIVQYGAFSDKLADSYSVEVTFSDASGIIKGAQVRLAGAKVGEVTKAPVLTSDGKVVVKLSIREDAPKLDTNSAFQIQSLSILGDKAIVITPPKGDEPRAGTFIKDGDHIVGGGPGGFEAIQSDAANIASDAAVLMTRARTTLSKIDNALDEVRAVTGLLTESVDSVNNDLLSEENLTNFSAALADLRASSENIKVASAEIKPVLTETRSAIQSVQKAADGAGEVFAKASVQIDNLEPTLKEVPRAVQSITEAADTANQAIKQVTNKEGLAGTLIYEKEPAENMDAFLRNLRRHGILGYKDDSTYDERDPRNRYRGMRR